jgi:hypothetical protein
MSGPVRPRALLVCFNRLFPANQGNARRIMQLVGFYQKEGFEVDLLYHNEEGFDAALSLLLAKVFARVTVVRSTAPKTIMPGHVCHIDDWYDPGLGAAARDMHRLRGYRLVHANYVWYAPLLDNFGSEVIKVLDTHDAFAERRQKYLQVGMQPQWFSCSFDDEDAALQRSDAAIAIQKEEALAFAARGHRNVVYLPYVEPQVRSFERFRGSRPLTFGYLGSGNDWNVLSFNDLLIKLQATGEAFPHPVVVAGGVSRHVRESQGVIKIGFVQELHAFYDAIDIALNPMVGGTGLKIKTVEPLCYGKPVLSTKSGVEGVGHLWQLPVFLDNRELAAFMVEQFRGSQADTVDALLLSARKTREAVDLEYEQQANRFVGWLKSKL